MITCSKEAPWGIHLSLLDDACPRCGWLPPERRTRPAEAPRPAVRDRARASTMVPA